MRTIPIDRSRLARFLLGGLLLAIGSGLLWFAPQRGLADAPIGWALVVAAVFLLAYRNYVEVNPARGRVAHRTGFGIGFLRERHDMGDIRRVEIRTVTRPSDDDEDDLTERTSFVVSVKSGPDGVLFEHDDMCRARLSAERVARALHVPLRNRLFGGSSLRDPGDLDLPLAERWSGDGGLRRAPVIDASSTLIVSHHGNASGISMPVPRPPLSLAVGAVAGPSLIAAGILLAGVFDLPLLVPTVFGSVVAFFTFFLLTRYTGRDRLRFDATTVELSRGHVPWRQRMKIADIEEILPHRQDLVLMGDERYLVIARPPAERDRELLRQFIERQISRRGNPSAES